MAPSRKTRFFTKSMSSLGIQGAVAQECLHDPLQLLGELIGCHRGRVDDLVEKAKILGDSFEVGVVG